MSQYKSLVATVTLAGACAGGQMAGPGDAGGSSDGLPPPTGCAPSATCTPEPTAYVDSAGTANPDCSEAKPCNTLAAALATRRSRIVIARGSEFTEPLDIEGRTVSIEADGAILNGPSSAGAIVTAKDSTVTISGVTFRNAQRSDTVGVSGTSSTVTINHVTISDMGGGAIEIHGGALTITQSTISQNSGGGILALNGARFVIVNNVFITNGGTDLPNGALRIQTVPSPTNRLEFNSFYKNVAADGAGAAIVCDAGDFTARNNILSTNNSPTSTLLVSGHCSHAYTIVDSGTQLPGTGNQSVDPQFVDPGHGNLRIMPRSPALGAADPTTILDDTSRKDVTGDDREAPLTIGACERPYTTATLAPCPAPAH